MSRPSKFGRAQDAREAGWISRRYRTVSERDAAVSEHEGNRKAENKIRIPNPRYPVPFKGKRQLARAARRKKGAA